MSSISKHDTDRFKASHRGESFTVVDTLDLGEALSHQSCLVANDYPICILLVLEDPLGPNDIVALLWSFNQSPHFVALEVVEFFMHGLQPISVFKRLIYLLRFQMRDKSMVSAKLS